MTTPPQPDPPPEPEGRSLLELVQQWAQRNLPAPESGHGGPECQWCPLCQLASMLRGENPDVADRLAEAGTALLAAARTLLDGTGTATPRPRPRPRPEPGPRVQQIRLDDRTDGHEGDSR